MEENNDEKALKKAYKDYLKVVNDDITFNQFVEQIESVAKWKV